MPAQRNIFDGHIERAREYGKRFAGSANGYAAKPGTGPADQSCGTCGNCRVRKIKCHNVYKCGLCEALWTHDRGTDVLKRSPACARWRAGEPVLINAFGKPI